MWGVWWGDGIGQWLYERVTGRGKILQLKQLRGHTQLSVEQRLWAVGVALRRNSRSGATYLAVGLTRHVSAFIGKWKLQWYGPPQLLFFQVSDEVRGTWYLGAVPMLQLLGLKTNGFCTVKEIYMAVERERGGVQNHGWERPGRPGFLMTDLCSIYRPMPVLRSKVSPHMDPLPDLGLGWDPGILIGVQGKQHKASLPIPRIFFSYFTAITALFPFPI
ncbi:hypothetical protein AAG906_029897 [Vitis piasezkii]